MGQVGASAEHAALPFGQYRTVRNCIVCGADDYEDKFAYTVDFLVNVRGHDRKGLAAQGWAPDDSATIVKCNACGCCYVRDVLLPSKEYHESFAARADDEEWIVNEWIRKAQNATRARYEELDFEAYVVRTLVYLAAKLQKRDVKFLDFAAGSAKASDFARALGGRDVVAYDLYWDSNHQKILDVFNYPGIKAIFGKDKLRDLGPFDAVVFQSAIEHVVDPKAELQSIYDVMSPGGYLYVNNPVMPLDKELSQLRSAKSIKKKDRISYYHPGHLNYMLPKHFKRIVTEVGFEITSITHFPPVPLTRITVRDYLLRNAKFLVRYLQNVLQIPYDRHFYIVQKPVAGG